MISRHFLIGGGIFTGAILYSYLAALLYHFTADIQEPAKIWSAWSALFSAQEPETSSHLWLAFGAPLIAGIFAGGAIQDLIKGKNPDLPKASWANPADIKKAGLAGNHGLILGKFQGHYIMSNTPTHIMVVAPTRSGKGVGIATPNLLNFSGSIICLDLKHENHKNTAGFREQYGRVYKWSPMAEDGRSHCYNPFSSISKDKFRRITELQIFATTLIQEPVHSDPVWAEEAQALFIGLALYVFETQENPTIGAINRLLGSEADLGDICRNIVKTHKELPSSIAIPLNNFANKAAKERSGVKTTINKALKLWNNPAVDAATSRSDFDISSLRTQRASIYVSVGTEEIATLAPLLRIFFEQTIKTLSRRKPGAHEPHQVLIVLDEFHMLGRMDIMKTAFSLLAGYNVRVMAIVQSLGWLDTIYDRATRNGILSCCAHQIFFATNDPETEEYVSRACGEKTAAVESSSKRASLRYDPPTKSTSYRTVPLITRHEVRSFDSKQQIILAEAGKPIKADKIRYFEDKNLKRRSNLSIRQVPSLLVEEKELPKFDIAIDQAVKLPEKDPNQGNFLEQDWESSDTDLTQIIA